MRIVTLPTASITTRIGAALRTRLDGSTKSELPAEMAILLSILENVREDDAGSGDVPTIPWSQKS